MSLLLGFYALSLVVCSSFLRAIFSITTFLPSMRCLSRSDRFRLFIEYLTFDSNGGHRYGGILAGRGVA